MAAYSAAQQKKFVMQCLLLSGLPVKPKKGRKPKPGRKPKKGGRKAARRGGKKGKRGHIVEFVTSSGEHVRFKRYRADSAKSHSRSSLNAKHRSLTAAQKKALRRIFAKY